MLGPQQRGVVAYWFIAVVAVATFAIGVMLSHRVEPGVRVQAVTLAGDTPALQFLPAGAGPHRVALLAHGVTASKETLFRLGEALAAAGFVSLAIDLPGHAQSPRLFDPDANVRELEQVARAIGSVDVFVGHSMGAYAGAASVRYGHLTPRLFIALGALPNLGDNGPPLLILAGAFEEAVPPALLRTQSDARVVISSWSDHALEPYDPRLVEAAVRGACEAVGYAPPRAAERWRERLLGVALAVLSALGMALGLPKLPLRLARARALIVVLLVLTAIALSADTWIGSAPIGRRSPMQLAAVATCLIVIVGAGKMGLPRWSFAALAAALAVVLGLFGAHFLMLLLALTALVLVSGAVIGTVAARGGVRRDGDLAMAILVGYAVGQCLPRVF